VIDPTDILTICARVKAGKPEPGDLETLALWCEKHATWLRQPRDRGSL
jgi:hypothetical protein